MISGKRNRQAGLSFERWLAKVFRWIGYTNVITSRQGSRLRDSQKVDLMNQDESITGRLPYNIQAKNAVGTLKYGKLLEELPNVDGIMNVVIHNQTKKVGTRYLTTGQYAILSLNDLLTLIQQRDDRKPARSLVSFTKGGAGTGILQGDKEKAKS